VALVVVDPDPPPVVVVLVLDELDDVDEDPEVDEVDDPDLRVVVDVLADDGLEPSLLHAAATSPKAVKSARVTTGVRARSGIPPAWRTEPAGVGSPRAPRRATTSVGPAVACRHQR
jgi:hypothetical protein